MCDHIMKSTEEAIINLLEGKGAAILMCHSKTAQAIKRCFPEVFIFV